MTDPDFWHQRWARGEIGFHRSDVHPALQAHWPDIVGERDSPVLVPLCGKSLDLCWLASRGHEVVGVELDGGAIAAYFDEAGLEPEVNDDAGPLRSWRSGRTTLWQGDFFDFQDNSGFELFYDRAALIALPRSTRTLYLDHLARLLLPDAVGLLITLEYRQAEMEGPPFAVLPEELEAHDGLRFECLARDDVLSGHPRFAAKGVTSLHEAAYAVTRRAR